MPFTKLHNCILNSSIWNEANHVRIAWITMLAMADEEGRVKASMGGLAHQARLSLDDTTKAVAVLESPDADSSRPDHEGRRIEKVDGGWVLLNHGYYRELGMSEATREYWRKKAAARRHKDVQDSPRHSETVQDSQRQVGTHASASASASASTPEQEPVPLPPPRQPEPQIGRDAEELTGTADAKTVAVLLEVACERFAMTPMESTVQRVRANVTELLRRGYPPAEIEDVLFWATDKEYDHLRGRPQSAWRATEPDSFIQWKRTMTNHKAQIEHERKRRNR